MQKRNRFTLFLGGFPYFHAMLYTKMFHGYDILKHLKHG